MALSTRMLGGLGAASKQVLDRMRQDVAQLAQQVAAARAEAADGEARLRDEIAQARAETEELRQELRTVLRRMDEQAQREQDRIADIEALQRRLDEGAELSEELRLKIAGLAEQWRWESEDLRKGLGAVAEWARQPA